MTATTPTPPAPPAEIEVSAALLNEFDRAEMNRTAKKQTWQHLIAPFRTADHAASWLQLAGNLAGVVASEVGGAWALHHATWLVPVFVCILAGFLTRLFIISHDCGHGSFFNDARLNDAVGIFTGFFLFTPYHAWRKAHAIHHATTGDLDRRGTGDVLTLTVDEYLALPPAKRLGYRLFRNPFVMHFLGSVFVFILMQRFTNTWGFKPGDELSAAEKRNVHVTTVVGVAMCAFVAAVGGWQAFLFVHLAALVFGGAFGIFLFYVQHQYEGVYWRRHGDWEYLRASVEGSSWLELPQPLRFFSGNIGVHHIHHLAPKVPNYRLYPCLRANEMFRTNVTKIGLVDAFKTLRLKLWDEQQQRMIGWSELPGVVASRSLPGVPSPLRAAAAE